MFDVIWHDQVTHTFDVPDEHAEEVASHLALPLTPHAPPRTFDPKTSIADLASTYRTQRYDRDAGEYVPSEPFLFFNDILGATPKTNNTSDVEFDAVEASAWFALLGEVAPDGIGRAEVEAHFEGWPAHRTLSVQDVIATAQSFPRETFDYRWRDAFGRLCSAFLTADELVTMVEALEASKTISTPVRVLLGLRPVATDSEEARARTEAFRRLDPARIQWREAEHLLAATPTADLYAFLVHRLEPTKYSPRLETWPHVCLVDDPAEVVENLLTKGPDAFDLYAGVTRLLKLDADARQLSKFIVRYFTLSRKNYDYNTPKRCITRLHDPRMATVLYDLIRKNGWEHKLKEVVEGEGANVVEGFVGMCGRKGTKRDFALKVLRGYVERGHEALVKQSIARAPDKIARLLTDELFPEPDPDAPTDTLARDAWPEWLREIADVPEVFTHHLEITDFPPLYLTGHDAPLPDTLADRIFATLDDSTPPKDTTPEEFEQRERAHAALSHLRAALDPARADAFWLECWEKSSSCDVLRTLGYFGHERSILFVGNMLGIASSPLSWRRTDATRGLLDTREALAYEQIAYASVVLGRFEMRSSIELASGHLADTNETLLPRYFPKFGLDERAERTIDYGTRRFAITLNMSCELSVRDLKTSKTRASLPKPRKDEDAEAIGFLIEDFSRQKKRIRRMRDVLIKELERDLVRVRPRDYDGYVAFATASPLHRRICASILWGVYDAKHQLVVAFRPDIEGELLGVDYETVSKRRLTTKGRYIAPVHPVDLSETELRTWSEHFAEQEIVPLFPQLDRLCFRPDQWDDERAWIARIPKFEDVSIRLRKFPDWQADYTGYRPKYWFAVNGHERFGVSIRLINSSYTWEEGSGIARGLFFSPRPGGVSSETVIPWKLIPARVVSEALRDVTRAYEKVHGPREH